MKYNHLKGMDSEGKARAIINPEIQQMVKAQKHDASNYRKAYRMQEKVLKEIFTFYPEVQEECSISTNRWGDLVLSEIESPEVFSQLMLNLTDRFGDPVKAGANNNTKVRFSWEIEKVPDESNYWEICKLHLQATPEINGCILVEEEVQVEAKTIPAHTETRYSVKCE